MRTILRDALQLGQYVISPIRKYPVFVKSRARRPPPDHRPDGRAAAQARGAAGIALIAQIRAFRRTDYLFEQSLKRTDRRAGSDRWHTSPFPSGADSVATESLS
jgi:hypothetical protein